MRIKAAIIFLFSSLFCFGGAGFADAYNDFQSWVFPAYLTCIIIGICIFALLTFLSWRFRIETDRVFTKTSEYLRSHRILGVLVGGILSAISVGIGLSVLGELILLTIILMVGVVYSFPFVLAIGEFRNKFLLNKKVIKWESIFAISAILASVIFIALIDFNILSFSEDSISARSRHGLYDTSHPWDSLKEIWGITGILLIEIVLSILFVSIGNGIRYIRYNYRKRRMLA